MTTMSAKFGDEYYVPEIQDFWKDHSWKILTVLGVPAR